MYEELSYLNDLILKTLQYTHFCIRFVAKMKVSVFYLMPRFHTRESSDPKEHQLVHDKK